MRVVIAPDKFKGSLTSREVARAMEAGLRRVFPGARISSCPLADGGEGTVDALIGSLGGRTHTHTVAGPIGAPVRASYGLLTDGRAVVEVAAACGLALLGNAEPDPLGANSYGVGQLLAAALDRGAAGAIVGIGGTASSDGGSGAAAALGWRFVDAQGRELPRGGGPLLDLMRVDGAAARPVDVPVVGLYDVTNPLVGALGAARIFGPQKGATHEQVEVLERALVRLSERVEADLGLRVAELPGAGAGGGLGAGLVAFCGAELTPGLEMVMDAVGLDEQLVGADLAITGEGRLDAQSLAGKTPVGVAMRARAAGVKCVAIAGDVDLDDGALRDAGFDAAASLVAACGIEEALRRPRGAIEQATAALVEGYI
jgi:glycerate kinase